MTIDPLEDDPPLVVNSDRIEALEISPQLLETVCWRNPQDIKPDSGVDHFKFALRLTRHAVKLANDLVLEQELRPPIAKRLDRA